jgi:hypothetical protein
MRKTRFRKFSAGIYHTTLKKKKEREAKSAFVPGFFDFCKTNRRISRTSHRLPAAKSSNKVRHVSINNILAFDSSARFGAGDIILYAWAPLPNLLFYIVIPAGS